VLAEQNLPLLSRQFPAIFPPAVAKVYIVNFRTHDDRRPSKFIVLADNMKSAIKMAWEDNGSDFQSRFHKSTAQAHEMKEGRYAFCNGGWHVDSGHSGRFHVPLPFARDSLGGPGNLRVRNPGVQERARCSTGRSAGLAGVRPGSRPTSVCVKVSLAELIFLYRLIDIGR
jgi:hypothetical protein